MKSKTIRNIRRLQVFNMLYSIPMIIFALLP